jgi:hypothetical protein
MNNIPDANTDDDRPLTREQAAAWLSEQGFPTTKTQLDRHASDGTGPQYWSYGRACLYQRRELMAWAKHQLRVRGKSYAANAEEAA